MPQKSPTSIKPDIKVVRKAIKKIIYSGNAVEILFQNSVKYKPVKTQVTLGKKGNQILISAPKGNNQTPLPRTDPSLIRALTKAWEWRSQLEANIVTSFSKLAETEGCTERYIRKLLPLSFLSPETVQDILGGLQPQHISLQDLLKGNIKHLWQTLNNLSTY